MASSTPAEFRVLFVCMGNICRSPTAEGVMRSLVADAELSSIITVDSAGTGAWHVGEPADRRAAATALRHGVTLTGTARQVGSDDFFAFDLIVAADSANFRDLTAIAPSGSTARIVRFADYAGVDVPDPYYGGADGFEEAFRIVTAGCDALLAELRGGVHTVHGLRGGDLH